MHRFFLSPAECLRQPLVLTGREAHHAARVLRVQPGELVGVLDGAGGVYTCAVRAIQAERVELEVVEARQAAALPWRLWLLQALPKWPVMELIVQKATELGVHRIVPLSTARVVSQPDEESIARKVEKWRWIAIDAIKQCGSAWLPHLEAPVALNDFLARAEPLDLMLVGALQHERNHPRAVLGEFAQQHGRLPASVGIFVGPEGDLTPAELEAILRAGAHPISLGPLVLRCDTAAVYCLAILNYELQAMAGPSVFAAPVTGAL